VARPQARMTALFGIGGRTAQPLSEILFKHRPDGAEIGRMEVSDYLGFGQGIHQVIKPVDQAINRDLTTDQGKWSGTGIDHGY